MILSGHELFAYIIVEIPVNFEIVINIAIFSIKIYSEGTELFIFMNNFII